MKRVLVLGVMGSAGSTLSGRRRGSVFPLFHAKNEIILAEL